MSILVAVIWIVLGYFVGFYFALEGFNFLVDFVLVRYLTERGYEINPRFIDNMKMSILLMFLVLWILLGMWIKQSITNGEFGALSNFFRSLNF